VSQERNFQQILGALTRLRAAITAHGGHIAVYKGRRAFLHVASRPDMLNELH
jgi:hypothetical protein